MIRALDLKVDLFHFNEGHAAFAGLELIRELMTGKSPLDFAAARKAARNLCVFTTHTPVEAGNEHHETKAVLEYLEDMKFTEEQLTEIGNSPFGMTQAGLRLSFLANGVAKLHTETAKKMWKDLSDKCDIVDITNGVHRGTWVDSRIIEAVEEKKEGEEKKEKKEDGEKSLMHAHALCKEELLAEIEKKTGVKFSADALLVGFARRSATYKRHLLVLSQEEELSSLLSEGKLQIVFSGKAHPDDKAGKDQISKLVEMAKKISKRSFVYRELRHGLGSSVDSRYGCLVKHSQETDGGFRDIGYEGCYEWGS